MAGNLKVTFQDLQDAAGKLDTGSRDIEGILTQLRAQLDPIHATWEGAAKSEFDRMWADWESSSKTLLQSLDGIATLLRQAGTAYQEAEQAAQRGFQQ